MNLQEKTNLRRALLASTVIAGFGSVAAFNTAAIAQDQDDDDSIEEVIVTGSRILRPDVESVSPLIVTSAEDIRLSGNIRIEDMMNSLPQVEASTFANNLISNGSSGGAALDLRGLGTVRTLVLFNGHRMQPGGPFQNAPDVNQIPTNLIERVEIMTGGASAVYGADAVAGVVNFIMNDDFEGFEISASTSFFQHNNDSDFFPPLLQARNFDFPSGSTSDGQAYQVDIIMGGSFGDGRGHATVYGNWRKQEELLQGSRDYAACALNDSIDGCGGSANAIVPNFFIEALVDDDGDGNFDGVYDTTDFSQELFVNLTSDSGLVDDDGTNRYNYAPVNHFLRPDERWSFGGFANYEVSDFFEPYLEVNYMRDRTVAQIAESGTFFAEQYNLRCDNPLFSAAFVAATCGVLTGLDPVNPMIGVYIGKRNVEGGPRASNFTTDSFRAVVGTRGNLAEGWNYDISFQHGSTSTVQSYVNDFFAPLIRDAVDVVDDGAGGLVCASGNAGCIPYEVFTFGGVTEEQAGSLTGVATLHGLTKEYIVNGHIVGELPTIMPTASDPVQLVVGAEYRREVWIRSSDTIFEDGSLLGQGGPTVSTAGSYNVKELFGELAVPLVQDKNMIQDLTLELALRYSDYNLSGGSTTYKIGLHYSPIPEVKFRGSFNRAVRAPNVTELFIPQNRGLWAGTDVCAGATPVQTAAQCANSGVTAAQYGNISLSPASQYNADFGGNLDLTPEKAETWTFGVAANPLPGLRLSVDYWDIKMENTISIVDPALSVEQCGLTGLATFCDLVQRAPSGTLWQGAIGTVIATNINLAGNHWRGIDITTDYEMEAMSGTFRATLNASYLLEKTIDPLPGLDLAYDCAGTYDTTASGCAASPDWRHTAALAYDSDSFWAVTVKWRYFASVTGPDSEIGLPTENIAAQSYFDLVGRFTVMENVALTVGVNNLLDKEPPVVGPDYATNANTFAGYYDTLGRFIHANATLSF